MNAVETVKAICKERKIPISKLEKDLGFGNGYISQLKKGTFPDDRLYKIADYLGIDPRLLSSGETEDNKKTAIEHDDGYQRKRAKVMSLFDDLTEEEIDMIIAQLEGLKRYRSNQDSHQ